MKLNQLIDYYNKLSTNKIFFVSVIVSLGFILGYFCAKSPYIEKMNYLIVGGIIFVRFYKIINPYYFFIIFLVLNQFVQIEAGASLTGGFLGYIVCLFLLYINKGKNFFKRLDFAKFILEEKILFFLCLFCLFTLIQSIYIADNTISIRNTFVDVPGVRSLIITFSYLLVFSIIFIFFREKNNEIFLKLINIFLYLMAGVCIFSLLGYASHFFGFIPKLQIWGHFLTTDELIVRIRGTAHEPVAFTIYLIVSFFFALLLFTINRLKTYLFFIFLFALTLILTFSRGGILAFFVGLFCFFIIGFISRALPRRLFLIMLVSICLIMLIGYYVYLNNKFFALLIDTKVLHIFMKQEYLGFYERDLSAIVRIADLTVVKRVFNDFPLMGIGIGNLVYHSYKYFVYIPWLTDVYSEVFCTVGNLYSLLLIEIGFIGFILFVLFLVVNLFRSFLNLFISQDLLNKNIFLIFIGLQISLIIYLLFFPDMGILMWFVYALVIYINKNKWEYIPWNKQ